jgi:HlyD family secretion protein
MRRTTRWILIGLGVAAVAGAAIVLPMLDGGVEVEAGDVTRERLEVHVVDDGRTRVRSRYIVAAPVTGRLARITLAEGDEVIEGAPVAYVFPVPEDPRKLKILQAQADVAEARKTEAISRVNEARVRAEQAQREADRTSALAESSTVSRTILERDLLAVATAEQQLASAEATLRAAEAELAAARAALSGANPEDGEGEPVVVNAPDAGRVLRVVEKNERIVQAGAPLIEIGNVTALEVVVDVLSEDAVRISEGDAARIEEWGGDGILGGAVQMIEPDAFTEVSALGVEEQRVNVIVALDDAPAGLGAGYGVKASIVVWSGDDVLTVPTSALFRRRGAWQVFAVRDGVAELREVEIGHRSVEKAEVLSGLADGEVVILFPTDQIADGVKVSVTEG